MTHAQAEKTLAEWGEHFTKRWANSEPCYCPRAVAVLVEMEVQEIRTLINIGIIETTGYGGNAKLISLETVNKLLKLKGSA